MKKIIKNISALFLCGTMILSGCATAPESPVEGMMITESGNGNVGEVKIESGDTCAVIKVADFGEIKIKLFPEEAPYGVQNFIDLANSGYFNGKNIHRVLSDFMLQGGSLNGDGTGGNAADGGEFYCEINKNMRHFYGALCYANAGGKNSCQFYIVNNKIPQNDPNEQYQTYLEYYGGAKEQYESLKDSYAADSEEAKIIDTYVEYYGNSVDGIQVMVDTLNDEIKSKYQNGGTPFLDGCYTVFGQTVEGFEVIDAISAVETEMGSDGAESKPVTDVIIESVTIIIAE